VLIIEFAFCNNPDPQTVLYHVKTRGSFLCSEQEIKYWHLIIINIFER